MKTVVTILALQLLVGASAFADTSPSASEAAVSESGASAQTGSFADESPEQTKSRVEKFLADLENSGGTGGNGQGKAAPRGPRPRGNDWSDGRSANR